MNRYLPVKKRTADKETTEHNCMDLSWHLFLQIVCIFFYVCVCVCVGYPPEKAVHEALATVREYLEEHHDKVRVCVSA